MLTQICQAVSLAPAVQDKTTEFVVTSAYAKAVGTGHATVVVNDILLVQALTSPPQFARTFTVYACSGVRPVRVNGFESASIKWSSSPSKQICQAVSVPPAVHDKSAVLAKTFDTAKADGSTQLGISSTVISSIYTPLYVLPEFAASIIMAI